MLCPRLFVKERIANQALIAPTRELPSPTAPCPLNTSLKPSLAGPLHTGSARRTPRHLTKPAKIGEDPDREHGAFAAKDYRLAGPIVGCTAPHPEPVSWTT